MKIKTIGTNYNHSKFGEVEITGITNDFIYFTDTSGVVNLSKNLDEFSEIPLSKDKLLELGFKYTGIVFIDSKLYRGDKMSLYQNGDIFWFSLSGKQIHISKLNELQEFLILLK